MWKAEQQFARDSFQLALNGTSDSGLEGVGFQGFAALADEYSGTPAGSACSYYAGVCNLNLGNYDEAINSLNDVDADGAVLPAMKYGLLGDAYSEKQDYSKALGYYEKAADAAEADVIAIYYLKKLGMLNEFQGNKDAALEAYERIQRDYPNQQVSDWRDIEKYIYRLKPQM
jgi:tetratricopeptide (TPR) repeat protein